jgi:hypothetical protein
LLKKSHYESSGKLGWLEIEWYTSALGCDDAVNILGKSVNTTKKNAEALVVY